MQGQFEPRLLRKCASKGTNFKTAITKGLVGSILNKAKCKGFPCPVISDSRGWC